MLSEVSWMNPTRFVYMDPTRQSPPAPPYQPKICSPPTSHPSGNPPSRLPPPTKFLFPPNQKSIPPPPLNKNFQVITQ